MSFIDQLLAPVPLPLMLPVAQRFDRPVLEDVEGEISRQVRAGGYLANLKPGARVAITAGSRGITDMPLLIRTMVREIKAAGGKPFIFPAMGSHGGATDQGQKDFLRDYGITEESMGAPIVSSMETVHIGDTESGLPVHIDRHAHEADGIIVCNRIHPHVAFRGDYESGLMKMCAIGMGKQHGADLCHRLGLQLMHKSIPDIGKVMIAKEKILCALGILENAYGETAKIVAMTGQEIIEKEPALLKESWALMPRLFFDELDVLILDEMGKNICGTGFDCNVLGRYTSAHMSGGPSIARVGVLDLTDPSHGNANGVGVLDYTTARLHSKFKPEQTYPNSLTSTIPASVRLPMVLKNDKQCMQAAVKCCNAKHMETVRFVRIKNTKHMDKIWVSTSLKDYCATHPNLEIMGQAQPFVFNSDDCLF